MDWPGFTPVDAWLHEAKHGRLPFAHTARNQLGHHATAPRRLCRERDHVHSRGHPLYPLPLPFGLPLMTLGLALWMRSSDRFRDRVFRWAEDKPRIQKVLAKVGPKHHVPAPPAAAASHEPATAGGV